MRTLKYAIALFSLAALLVPASDAFAAKKGSSKDRLLHNAQITEIDGTAITATQGETTYHIDAAGADIYRRYWGSATFDELMEGDFIQVWGTSVGTNITATKIRDLSIQAAKATFTGTISSIDSDAKTFNMQTAGRSTQTVEVSDTTSITRKSGGTTETKAFSDLQVGMSVKVQGVWNRAHNLVYNTRWVKIVTRTKNLSSAIITAIDSENKILTVERGGTSFTVNAANAEIRRRYNAKAEFSELMVGDFVRVWGTTNLAVINARRIKDLSIQAAKGTFGGTISSIDAVGRTFNVQSNARGTQTVNVYDYTVIKYKKRTPKTFEDLDVGDIVTLKGVWNRAHNLVYNTAWVNITQAAE